MGPLCPLSAIDFKYGGSRHRQFPAEIPHTEAVGRIRVAPGYQGKFRFHILSVAEDDAGLL